jgi:medium-chain acyl-[acyl-carrier-protein] hydrolase
LIGFELAAALEGIGRPPMRFFASACRPPHIPDPYQLHRLDDVAFSEALRARGGISDEVLQHSELREFVIPLLRADLMLAEAWRRAEPFRAGVPITVCAAPADSVIPWNVTSEWEQCTSSAWERQPFVGDHFFLREHPLCVFDFVLSRLGMAG